MSDQQDIVARLRAVYAVSLTDDCANAYICDEAADTIESLREALRFYADPASVVAGAKWSDGYPGGITFEDGRYTILDTGERAREAINAVLDNR